MSSLPKIYGLEELTATGRKLLLFVINKASQSQTPHLEFSVDELVEAGVYASMDEVEKLLRPDLAALRRLRVDTGELMGELMDAVLQDDWDDGRCGHA